MKIRLTSQNDACFETTVVTYPPAGLALLGENSSSPRVKRTDLCAATTRRHADSFGDRLLGFCCECLARMCEMYAASETTRVDGVTKSQERSLERIREDQSWASAGA